MIIQGTIRETEKLVLKKENLRPFCMVDEYLLKILVSEDMKEKLENSGLKGLKFIDAETFNDAQVELSFRKGKFFKSTDSDEFIKRALHEGSHLKCTDRVRKRLQSIQRDFSRLENPKPDDIIRFQNRLNKIVDRLKSGLEMEPNC